MGLDACTRPITDRYGLNRRTGKKIISNREQISEFPSDALTPINSSEDLYLFLVRN